MLAKKQGTYTLLDADDEDEDNVNVNNSVLENRSSGASVSETKKADHSKKRFRKKTESHDDEDDEVFREFHS